MGIKVMLDVSTSEAAALVLKRLLRVPQLALFHELLELPFPIAFLTTSCNYMRCHTYLRTATAPLTPGPELSIPLSFNKRTKSPAWQVSLCCVLTRSELQTWSLHSCKPTGIDPNASASTSSSASSAARINGTSSTPAKEIPARAIVIGVSGVFAGSALVVWGIRLLMIQRNVRANLAARKSATLKVPDMMNYVNLGLGPCEAPTYADEYTREELYGEEAERPQLDGNQRSEKG